MSRMKLPATKVKAIIRMRELGFTVTKISGLLNVSRVTVYDHTNPEYYKARLEQSASFRRRTKLVRAMENKLIVQKRWELEV